MAAKVDRNTCTGCGVCIESCPVEAIGLEDDKAVVNDNCTECGSCVDACPNSALSL